MSRRDMHSHIDLAQCIAAQVLSSGGGDIDGDSVDLLEYGEAEVVFNIGVNGGDTLNGTNNHTFVLQHANDDGAGAPDTWAAVGTDDVIGAIPVAGVVLTIDDAAVDDAVYRCGYVGGKKWFRVQAKQNGTLTNGTPSSVTVVRGRANREALADQIT